LQGYLYRNSLVWTAKKPNTRTYGGKLLGVHIGVSIGPIIAYNLAALNNKSIYEKWVVFYFGKYTILYPINY